MNLPFHTNHTTISYYKRLFFCKEPLKWENERNQNIFAINENLFTFYINLMEYFTLPFYNPIFDSLRAEKAKILRKIKGFGFLRLAYFFCLFRFSKNFFHLF